jgi:MFS family permease
MIFGGAVTGPIYDSGYMRELIFVGSAFSLFGMMMTSICKEYWQVLLSQGVSVGIGAGCLMLPSVAVMPQYFAKRRAFATGIAATGSSVGSFIFQFHQEMQIVRMPNKL